MPHPRIISHRGATDECPENTLPAFLQALALGAEAIELDVHATRDGVVVVHHDPEVRLSGSDQGALRPISDMEHGDLACVALGHAVRIPTLGEVLDAVADRATVYIEIKGRAIERAVVDVVHRSPRPDRCAVHSFDHRAVQRVRELAPGLRTGILLSSHLIDPVAALRAADAQDCWSECSLIDETLVGAVHAAGSAVIAWTVRDDATARRLAGLGVDGLCTDFVADTVRVLSTLECSTLE